jgi:integrase
VSFITYQAVCTSTLARWLKSVLSLSGIDSSFTAHSFRSASTSYAFNKGVSIKTIMDTANWASAQTFYKHYYKTVNSNSTIFFKCNTWLTLPVCAHINLFF